LIRVVYDVILFQYHAGYHYADIKDHGKFINIVENTTL